MGFGSGRSLIVPALVGLCLVMGLACKSSPGPEPTSTAPPIIDSTATRAEPVDETTGFQDVEPKAESVRETPRTLADKLNAQRVMEMIRFDFDKYDLRSDAMRSLDKNAIRLSQHNQLKVRIEGYCDERGTVEYNLALGERRARSARDYLVSKGIPASRITIISFGKERPLDPAHNERAWAKNRRDQFVLFAE